MALPYAIWVLGSAIVRAATPRIAQMLAKRGFKQTVGKAAEKLARGKNPPVITQVRQIKKVVDKSKTSTGTGKPKTGTGKPKTGTGTGKPKNISSNKPKSNQTNKPKGGKIKKIIGWGLGGYGVTKLGEELWDWLDDKPKKEDVKVISKTDKKTDKKASVSNKKSYKKGTGAVKVPNLTREFIEKAKRFDEKKEKVSSNKKEKVASKKDYKPVYDKAQAEKRKKLTENIVSPKGVKRTNITAGGTTGFGPKGNIFASNDKERKRLMAKYGGTGSAAAKAAAKGTQGNLKKKKVNMGGFIGKPKKGHQDFRKGGLFYG